MQEEDEEERAPLEQAARSDTARSYTGRYLAAVQAASSTVAAWLAGGNVDEVRGCLIWLLNIDLPPGC